MANTTNFNWETPDDTDLVKDGAAAIRTLGSAIDTSLVDLKGGTTGQVLAKNSNTDMDFIWASDASGIPATIFDAKGDIIAATAADTAARLAVGSNNTVLTADSSTATGLKWATVAAGGMTSLATGTLSGSSLILDTISQDYVHLQLILTDVNVANSGEKVYARIDNSTQTYYAQGGQSLSVNGTTPTLGTISKFDSLIELNAFTTSSGNQVNQVVFNIYNYTATGVYNMGDWQSVFIRNTGGNEATTKGFWSYNNTGLGAISRIDIFPDSTFNGGTYTLYGVK